MRDITHESAVSTGSVYHHFKDKEDVAITLYEHMLKRLCKTFEQIIQNHESAHDQCKTVVSYLFHLAESEPDVMTFIMHTKHQEFLSTEPPVCSSKPFRMMRDMVQHGMESGEIEQRDVHTAAACLFGGTVRMIISHLDGILEKPLSNYLDDVWTCSWRAVATA